MNAGDAESLDWVVSQIGARQHYAAPRALYRRGALRHLYTDAWCYAGRTLLRRLPDPARSFANRYHEELPGEYVTAFNGTAIWNAVRREVERRFRPAGYYYQHHNRVGRQFATNVRQCLHRQSLDPARHAFFGFSTGSYETLAYLGKRGFVTVLDQIAPAQIEKEILVREKEQWPGWSTRAPEEHGKQTQRLKAEWAEASFVLVNSDWSKSSLTKQGVPPEKIIVVPLAYEPSVSAFTPQRVSGPLNVLFLGTVNLRKGIQYLMGAAHLLKNSSIRFTVDGPLDSLTEKALAQAPPNMTFRGRIPRNRVSEAYRQADIFVLPTLSDGFAITQLEAMAHGLPVVTTPNCGRVVTDGEDGFIVPVRDTEALAGALRALDTDRDHLMHMSRNAIEKVREFTVDKYAQRFFEAVNARLHATAENA